MKLLLIEDSIELSKSILFYTKNEGYLIEAVHNFNDAFHKIKMFEYDCIILDISLPGGSGLELLKELKEDKRETGVVIISAKNSLDDKISGLNLGADDYLSKPFHLSELNARIKSVLRRRIGKGNNWIEFNEIKLSIENRETVVNNIAVELTKKEFDILLFFLSNRNKVLTKESIAEHIWGDNADTFDSFDFVYTHLKNLRKKLLNNGCHDYIKSIYGVGYKFESE